MIIRLISLFCIIFFSTACAHTSSLTPRQHVANHVTSAFVRVHTYTTYEIDQCLPETTECAPMGLQITTTQGIGSGGVIKQYEAYSVIMTAAHVISGLNTLPSSDITTHGQVIRAFSDIMGLPHEEVTPLFQAGRLSARGISTTVTVVASNGTEYQVDGARCHSTLDVCFAKTSSRIDNVTPLVVSDEPPVIGDRMFCAQGPFGYAIPGMMVPLFEGIYSGRTPTPAQDYYTFPVAPGSSGSLIVNQRGEVVGLVTSFMYGPLCADSHGCHAFSSGITVSIAYTDVREFFNHLITFNRDRK